MPCTVRINRCWTSYTFSLLICLLLLCQEKASGLIPKVRLPETDSSKHESEYLLNFGDTY